MQKLCFLSVVHFFGFLTIEKRERKLQGLCKVPFYIEKIKVDKPVALAVDSISENKDAATVYLKKAVITSTGAESVKP